ncbi:MAG: addiction module protein [Salegentibacter sp.]
MDTVALKDRIKKYIEHADDRMLKIINGIIEANENEVSDPQKKILEERLKYHQANPQEGKTWDEARDSLKEKYV